MSEAQDRRILDKLEQARMALLDLGKRNRLINFKERSRSALLIVDEKPVEIFSLLVDRGKSLKFLSDAEADERLDKRAKGAGDAAKKAAKKATKKAAKKKQARRAEASSEDEGYIEIDVEVVDDEPRSEERPSAKGRTALPSYELMRHTGDDAGIVAYGASAIEDGAEEEGDKGLAIYLAQPEEEGRVGRRVSQLMADEIEEEFEEEEADPEDDPDEESEDAGDETGPKEARESSRHTDLFLQTPLNKVSLQSKLIHLYREAENAVEEQGANLLFIALGFLEWKEPEAPKTVMRAPLVLVPVRLERKSVVSKFSIEYTGEEIQRNICLEQKLQTDFGLRFDPDLKIESRQGFKKYVELFEEQIAELKTEQGWKVTDGLCLGLFSFSKFLMFRDLDPANWPEDRPLTGRPLLRALLGNEGWDDGGEIDEEHDRAADVRENFQVMDADSSQRRVIVEAKHGRNLLVQGPPGTGKSQTITNTIAECLGAGKKVLFVSEKMAALSVVRSRLEKVGLGEFCLELHSRTASKKAFLDSIRHCMEAPLPVAPREDDDLAKFEKLREELATFGEALLEPLSPSEFSPYRLFGEIERFKSREFPKVPLVNPERWDSSTYKAAVELAEEMASCLQKVGVPLEHPLSPVYATELLPSDFERVGDVVSKVIPLLERIVEKGDRLLENLQAEETNTLLGYEDLCRFWQHLADCPKKLPNVLETVSFQLDPDAAFKTLELLRQFQSLNCDLEARFYKDRIPFDRLEDLERTLLQNQDNPLRFINLKYHAARREVRDTFIDTRRKSTAELLGAINFFMRHEDKRHAVNQSSFDSFGEFWQGEKSPYEDLKALLEWMEGVKGYIDEGVIDANTLVHLALRLNLAENDEMATDLATALEELKKELAALDSFLKTPDLVWESACRRETGQVLTEVKNIRSEREGLWDWVAFRKSQKQAMDGPLAETSAMAERGDLDEANLKSAVLFNYFSRLLNAAFQQRPAIGNFRRERLERAISRFAELDRQIIRHARQRLAHRLGAQMPRTISGLAGSDSALSKLQYQLNLKRRHKPIRQLLTEAGSVIRQVKPCFMMSPLSVAQFLPPELEPFDVVIFDEASQIKPEDALGAVARGQQLIVVGDNRQLPPTRFFSKFDSEEDDGEVEENLKDLESVLDACGAAGMPSRMLSWHYRSRHDSLISVSNVEFYESNLTIFPSPYDRNEHFGLHFEYVEDGEFQRGGAGTNPVEAERVALAVMEHARANPHKSLGVGAFSVRQQTEIQNQLELLRRQANDSKIEAFFSSHNPEPFFVKNLENIQGDERDIIFLSVCYGPSGKDRKLSMNFGPLNQEGGERRLNVLITRAKEKCVVFGSIRGDDIDLERTNARGVHALRNFLRYAELAQLDTPELKGRDLNAPFEKEVAEAIRDNGYDIVPKVGAAGFFIDIGVKHPDKPGKFVLGIECDGAAYRSASSARERERLRNEVLRGLGWRLHRIWSVDWHRDRDKELRRALRAIDRSLRDEVDPGSVASDLADEDDEHQEIERSEQDGAVSELQDLSEPYEKYLPPPTRVPREDRLIAAIVKIEQPVHQETVYERLKEVLETSRATPKVKEEWQGWIFAALRNNRVEKLGNERAFLVVKGWSPEEVRLRRREDFSPDPDHVSETEILEAAARIFAHVGAMKLPDLVKNVSRLLGYKSLGSRTQDRLTAVFNRKNLRDLGLKMDHKQEITKDGRAAN